MWLCEFVFSYKECISNYYILDCLKLQNPPLFAADFKSLTSILALTIFCTVCNLSVEVSCYGKILLVHELLSNTGKTVIEMVYLAIILTTLRHKLGWLKQE